MLMSPLIQSLIGPRVAAILGSTDGAGVSQVVAGVIDLDVASVLMTEDIGAAVLHCRKLSQADRDPAVHVWILLRDTAVAVRYDLRRGACRR